LEKDLASTGRQGIGRPARIADAGAIVRTRQDHLDGRKLAGVKRRLQLLIEKAPAADGGPRGRCRAVERLRWRLKAACGLWPMD
jgi:hypothetical protein